MASRVQRQRLAFEANWMTSSTTIRRAAQHPEFGIGHELAGMRSARIVRQGMKVSTAIDAISRWMLQSYRNETVYKNAIANQVMLKRHGPIGAALLTEFKVANSVADCVIANSRATVYEIKSELDSASRLHTQLDDYSQVFSRTCIVTHRTLARQYLNLIGDRPIGLVVMDDEGELRTRRKVGEDTSRLSVDQMIRCLRKHEYTAIAEEISGGPIGVSPVQHFKACLAISRTVPVADYSPMFEKALRARMARQAEAIASPRFANVRHQLLTVDPSAAELANLGGWMQERL